MCTFSYASRAVPRIFVSMRAREGVKTDLTTFVFAFVLSITLYCMLQVYPLHVINVHLLYFHFIFERSSTMYNNRIILDQEMYSATIIAGDGSHEDMIQK